MNLFSADLGDISITDIEEFLAIKAPEDQRPTEGVRIAFSPIMPDGGTISSVAETHAGSLWMKL